MSTGRRLSAAAVVTLVGGLVLAAWLFRGEVLRWLLFLAVIRFGWLALRRWAGLQAPRGRSVGQLVLAALAGFVTGRRRGAVTHPCSQCGSPIGAPSRAAFCSPACRTYARLEREETARRAEQRRGFGEVPFE
ncbi:MAG TPA: hypothetical protein VFG23_19210 [Polyangia bacterium]|nr:hypothetical protein [Polyangia bacterium]